VTAGLGYAEMVVVGLLQGVSELFPVSSLGHSVLVPALLGGRWAHDLDISRPGSPYLDSLVAMHVATAAALVIFFWRHWASLLAALGTSVRDRAVRTPAQRLVWLLIIGTVPVGLAGLALDKPMREYLGKPLPAAAFLLANGVLLFVVERLHRRAARTGAPPPGVGSGSAPPPHPDGGADPNAQTVVLPAVTEGPDPAAARGAVAPTLDELGWRSALAIGACQILALLPGISRSGATIAGGLLRGLSHRDAARFAFLLATPVIAAAGVLKLPELARPELHDAIGPTLVGSLVAGIASYVSVRFLTGYFATRTLTPFAVYCVLAGSCSLIYLSLV
jgi:undecaprenyl-diphosphatase